MRAALPILALAIVAGCGGGGEAGGAGEVGRLEMRPRGCLMTVDVFEVPVEAVRRAVPHRHEPAVFPDGRTAALDVWVLQCDRWPIDDGRAGPASLAIVGAVLTGPGARPLSAKGFRHYVLSAASSSAPLARVLRSRGIPVEVGKLRGRRDGRRRRTDVLLPAGPYSVSAPLRGARDRPHDHRNAWLHTGRDGRTATLELFARNARDVYCPRRLCGRIAVRRGTGLASLLGTTTLRARVSLDHLPLDPVLRVERQAGR